MYNDRGTGQEKLLGCSFNSDCLSKFEKKNFAPKWTLMQSDKGVGDEVMKAMTKTQHAT